MAQRTVTDADGRTWTCITDDAAEAGQGRDVVLSCSTPSVTESVRVTVGWQWEEMSEKGFARLISQASPVPRR